MRPLSILLVPALLLAALPPAAGDANYTEQNMAYILELAGYASMPDEIVEVSRDMTLVHMPAAEAVRLAAELHARTDLRSLGTVALEGTVAVGDVEFLGLGCERVVPAHVRHTQYHGIHMQLFIHPGNADNVLRCDAAYTVEWTTKVVQHFDEIEPVLIAGSGREFTFWGITFGAVNGVVAKVPEA